ncbi:MAG: 4Fe-4S dicluster domain-containing protein [Candidatus Omnitrophica bacterium]|nr:4Fe-4S dicluster domain-containing protein [Candidatus Omnitrophota bacterium]
MAKIKAENKKTNAQIRIYCDIARCVGCKSCEIACAVAHSQEKNVFLAIREEPRPKKRVFVQVTKEGSYPLQCRHCDEPACVLACMSAAITRDERTGMVTIDKDRCVGCGMCIMSCPFGALIMDKDKKVSLKCDFCIETAEPACVQACPTGCLFLGTLEEFKERIGRSKEKK